MRAQLEKLTTPRELMPRSLPNTQTLLEREIFFKRCKRMAMRGVA